MTATAILSLAAHKICRICGQTKCVESFYAKKSSKDGFDNRCKICTKNYVRDFLKNPINLEKKQIEGRLYYEINKEKLLVDRKVYRDGNKDAVRGAKKASYQKKKAAYLENCKKYRESARGKIVNAQTKSEYTKKKRIQDPVYALKRRIYCCISAVFSRRGFTKRSRTHEILGCDWSYFKSHIEKQFQKGMSWDNRSQWHLDHIQPLASALTEAEVVSLNHFTNLRPMWAVENLVKGAQITHLI